MVAYSFQPQFVAPIVMGLKDQTIRAPRKRHARADEALQLFTGMRTRQCRRIGSAICADVLPIVLDFVVREVRIQGRDPFSSPADLDSFARRDGFADWSAMRRFWAGLTVFEGVLIRWDRFAAAADMGAVFAGRGCNEVLVP